MPELPARPPLVPLICGPTAGGKSHLAVELALHLRDTHNITAQIVTADAFQVYQGLDIGTAKPTIEEQRGVPHHLVDIVDPATGQWCGTGGKGAEHSGLRGESPNANTYTPFTVDRWLQLANRTIAELHEKGILPIVVGGTHLYVKALLDGLFEGPEPNHALRAELSAMDPAARRAELERVDPRAAAKIHPNDMRRTVRALEVFRQTGTPISTLQTQWDQTSPSQSEGDGESASQSCAGSQSSNYLLIALDWPAELLNPRINARVKNMIAQGLVEEAHSLYTAGSLGPQAREALGYKQLIEHFERRCSLDEAIEKTKIETRRFAKNQRTWLKRLRTTRKSLWLAGDAPTPNAIQTIRDSFAQECAAHQ